MEFSFLCFLNYGPFNYTFIHKTLNRITCKIKILTVYYILLLKNVGVINLKKYVNINYHLSLSLVPQFLLIP